METQLTNPREFMELAVETMRNSVSESRTDKSSPFVGAVLVTPDGRIEKACRGELSDGDHAEYTLLERKLASIDLTGAVLFSTLEPCAPGARSHKKEPCAKRIVDRRIAKVWVGIEDPDPLVDSKGIKYLQDHGVTVELFERDLQENIRQINTDFIRGAEERARRFGGISNHENLSELEAPILFATLDDLDDEEMIVFSLKDEGFEKVFYGTDEFFRIFTQLKYLAKHGDDIYPTGLGVLLFGKYPQTFFPHAVIRASFETAGRNEDIATFSGNLPKQAKDSLNWYKKMIGRQIDRSTAQRREIYDYPVDAVRESINNALAHRSYDIVGASVYLEINDETITIRSPGGPVKPISIERMKRLDSPFLSKNPKITYAFEKLDLSENRGLGFKTFRSLSTVYNRPLPTATYDDPYLIFTFSRAYGIGLSDDRFRELTNAEAKGFDYIRLNSPFTRKGYEGHQGLSTKTAERHLARFVGLNLIRRVGAGPKTYYEIVD